MDNLSLSPFHQNIFWIPAGIRNPKVFAHRTKLTANPTKSSDMSSKCSQTFLSARSLHCLDIYHDSSRAFQFRAKAKQGEETNDFAPERKLNYNNVLVKFLRPYSMIGIFMLCMGYMGRTCMESPELLNWSLLPKAVAIFVAVLSTVAYNSGLNQLYDIEIDRINKPDLVLASGVLPLGQAWLLVTSYFVIGILTSVFVQSKVLMACICIKFFAVYIYNAPPIRLKRTSAGGIFCGLLTGDIYHDIHNRVSYYDLYTKRSSRRGRRAIAFLGSGILMHNYIFAIIMAIKNPQVFRQAVMIPAHIAMACILAYQVWKLEKAKYNKEDSQVFYKFLWKLVDAEWVIFPFI